MPQRLLVALIFVFLCSHVDAKRVNKGIPFEDQLKEENVTYEIRHSFDLSGKTVIIPKGSSLVFKCGGSLSNGTIKGENVTIKLRKKCLSNVNVVNGIKSNQKVVKSSFYRHWDGNSLASLCAICPNGGKVILDAKFEYTIEKTLTPDGSIVIDGKGKTVRTINPTSENFCPTFLAANNIERVEITDLKVDGGWKNKSLLGGTDPNRWFIITKNVDNVVIENCRFKDLKASFGNWREVEDALMLFRDFRCAIFRNNEIVGCKAPEGLLFRHEPDNSEDMVILENNKFDFVRVSSNVNIYFCRFRIINNHFGFCRGSGVNAFGHHGQINKNIIEGSYNSAGIDVSEYGEMGYFSTNIEVKDNKCGFCYGGFFAGYDVSRITLTGNYYDAGDFDADALSSYDTGGDHRLPDNDRMLYLGGTLSDIIIKNNTFLGGNSLLYQWDDVQRNNIQIDGNVVTVVHKPVRSVIALSSVNGMVISNNTFTGTGMTLGSLGYPSFICSQPLPEGSINQYGNVEISGNHFFVTSSADSCYVFSHTIYDKRKYHGLAKMGGSITIHDNTCNKPANVLLNTGDFTSNSDFQVDVRGNDFHGGRVIGNIPSLIRREISSKRIGVLGRGSRLSHDIILRDGNDYYYVICGGVTAKSKIAFVEKDGLIYDGDAVLQKITIKE